MSARMTEAHEPHWLTARHPLALLCAGVTLLAALLAEGLLQLLAFQFDLTWAWWQRLLIVGSMATLMGMGGGVWAGLAFSRRLHRSLEVSRAWLRGNLSLRIADPGNDELSQLAEQLDLLVQRMEQDEQDLGELTERNSRLTDQVRALAVVEERNRLARELHDSVKQHLFSLGMTAGAIRTRLEAFGGMPAEVQEMMRDLETAAQTAQRETTRLIEDLRPGSLQEQGLAKALNDYALLFGAQEHLLVYVEVDGSDRVIPPSVTEALYRVAQEALHNVARHARAARVDLHLRATTDRISLTIADNGCGFDPGVARRGLGLLNMQERMLSVGGRLALESQVGSGARVVAEVDLPRAAQANTGRLLQRPNLAVENWAWLGAKLVIPVGQTWPWHPNDLQHLRGPFIEAGAVLHGQRASGFMGFGQSFSLSAEGDKPLLRIHPSHSGYEWESDEASWALRRIRGLSGRMVLTRNQQALAALQYQGRQMHTWNEIIYNEHGYCLLNVQETDCSYVLTDADGEEILCVMISSEMRIAVRRSLPLPLLALVVVRILDEWSATALTATK